LLSGLDFFEEETLLRKSQMQMRKIRREEASLRQRIFRQAREAFDELKDSERSHQISLKRLEQSANALDLTESRYERGLSDNLDVLDSESAYSEAELDAASTLVSYNIASVKLGYVLGVLNVEWLGLSLPQTSRHQNSVSVN
ncbi:MAG: TolC family protein, partial [Thermodesulfobacteriota bacterium]